MSQAGPQLVTGRQALREQIAQIRREGKTIGLVPTMGALHEGHLSLVDASRGQCDWTVVTIFVNPTQFGPHEDFQQYPRTLEADLQLLGRRQADLVFAPPLEEMFRAGHETFVEVGPSASPLEGALRPGHFRGVATIVLKLLQLVPADVAYFGQKDYQQTVVVRRMVEDFDFPITIRTCPTVRESDGLAMSSRNAYLSGPERRRALSLSQSLELAARRVEAGEKDVLPIRQGMLELLRSMGQIEPQYIAFLREGTVTPVERIEGRTVVALAARIGATRLIDNCIVGSS